MSSYFQRPQFISEYGGLQIVPLPEHRRASCIAKIVIRNLGHQYQPLRFEERQPITRYKLNAEENLKSKPAEVYFSCQSFLSEFWGHTGLYHIDSRDIFILGLTISSASTYSKTSSPPLARKAMRGSYSSAFSTMIRSKPLGMEHRSDSNIASRIAPSLTYTTG